MPHHLAASLFAIVQLCPSHQHNRHRSLLRVSSSGRAPLPPTHPLFHPFDVAFALPKQFSFFFFFFFITKCLQPNKSIIKMARLIDAAWRMFRYIVAVLLFLAVTPVLSSFLPTRLQPRQPSEPDEPTRQTFGIGFDLAISYGCVDLHFYRS